MLKNLLLTPFSIFFLISCQTKKINQYKKESPNIQKRHGIWKEEYSSDLGTLVAVGRYKEGEKVGVWKTNFQNQLIQKDKIKKSVTKTRIYHLNGKIKERGQSRLDISAYERHWYYYGDWKFYDENGKLKYIKKYADGKKIDSISFCR